MRWPVLRRHREAASAPAVAGRAAPAAAVVAENRDAAGAWRQVRPLRPVVRSAPILSAAPPLASAPRPPLAHESPTRTAVRPPAAVLTALAAPESAEQPAPVPPGTYPGAAPPGRTQPPSALAPPAYEPPATPVPPSPDREFRTRDRYEVGPPAAADDDLPTVEQAEAEEPGYDDAIAAAIAQIEAIRGIAAGPVDPEPPARVWRNTLAQSRRMGIGRGLAVPAQAEEPEPVPVPVAVDVGTAAAPEVQAAPEEPATAADPDAAVEPAGAAEAGQEVHGREVPPPPFVPTPAGTPLFCEPPAAPELEEAAADIGAERSSVHGTPGRPAPAPPAGQEPATDSVPSDDAAVPRAAPGDPARPRPVDPPPPAADHPRAPAALRREPDVPPVSAHVPAEAGRPSVEIGSWSGRDGQRRPAADAEAPSGPTHLPASAEGPPASGQLRALLPATSQTGHVVREAPARQVSPPAGPAPPAETASPPPHDPARPRSSTSVAANADIAEPAQPVAVEFVRRELAQDDAEDTDERATEASDRPDPEPVAPTAFRAAPVDLPPGFGPAVPVADVAAFRNLTGIDLGEVPLRTGPAAAQAAESVGARAFTSGAEVHLGAGAGQPGTPAARALLGHELMHVAQQRAFGAAAAESGPHADAFEAQAQAVEHALLEGTGLDGGPLPGPHPAETALSSGGLSWTPATGFQPTPTRGDLQRAPTETGPSAGPPQPTPGPAAAPEEFAPDVAETVVPPYPDRDDLPGSREMWDHCVALAARLEAVELAIAEEADEAPVSAFRVAEAESGLVRMDDPKSLDRLAAVLYDRLTSRMRRESLWERERAGLALDLG